MDVTELTRTLLNTTQETVNGNQSLVSTLVPAAIASKGPEGPHLGKLLDEHGNFYVSRGKYVKCDITLPEEQLAVLQELRVQFGGTVVQRTGRAGKKLALFR